MKMLRALAGMIIGFSLVTASFACGDKLSVIGGGVRFERIYAARHPGRVVIYVPRESQLRLANDELRLADALKRAGHSVEVIDEYQGLQRALQMASADVVLVDVADARRLDAGNGGPVAATIVPVMYESAARNRRAALQTRCVTQLTRRSSQQLLRAVDDILERRSRGMASTCQPEPVPRGT